MSKNLRIQQIPHNLASHQRAKPARTIPTQVERPAAIPRGQERSQPLKEVCLMVNVQPITVLPKWAQWMVRYIYFRYGWAAMAERDGVKYSVEYRGVTPDESEARYLSSEPNASYTKVPWRSCLPIETVQFSVHDFPLSEVSPSYRNRKLPFVTYSRADMEALGERIEQTAERAEGSCIKA
jgi:hypothetical protein